MEVYISIILVAIFLVLAVIHFYWSLGGRWGFKKALPTNEKGEFMLLPRAIDSVIVGLGLSMFSVFYLSNIGFFNIPLSDRLLSIIYWVIPSIFSLRAIGDFKYVGFFKSIRNTDFSVLDTKFYSPLCLVIGLGGYWVNFL